MSNHLILNHNFAADLPLNIINGKVNYVEPGLTHEWYIVFSLITRIDITGFRIHFEAINRALSKLFSSCISDDIVIIIIMRICILNEKFLLSLKTTINHLTRREREENELNVVYSFHIDVTRIGIKLLKMWNRLLEKGNLLCLKFK